MSIQKLSRRQIFEESSLADWVIAKEQQFYIKSSDKEISKYTRSQKKVFDHYQAFADNLKGKRAYRVIAYKASTKTDYLQNFPDKLMDFCHGLKLQNLYLLEWRNANWLNFPFRNFKLRNAFKNRYGLAMAGVGFKITIDSVPEMLSYFMLSKRWGEPVIELISASEHMPIEAFLCDDGNLHIGFPVEMEKQIAIAARNANLLYGDVNICWNTFVNRLPER